MSELAEATDALLAARSADGDATAFGVLVRRHLPFLRAFATRLTGSAADADDAVQEGLIAAWRGIDGLGDPERVRSWLASIVSRKATDRIRARKPTSELDEAAPDSAPGPEQHAVAGSRLDALSTVLAALPDGQRQCWLLKEVEGLSYEEIAERLGTTPVVVRGRLARARASVATGMEAWR